MPKIKATKTSQIHSVLQDLPEEFIKSPNNELYCNSCSFTVSCNKGFLVESHQNTLLQQVLLCLIVISLNLFDVPLFGIVSRTLVLH